MVRVRLSSSRAAASRSSEATNYIQGETEPTSSLPLRSLPTNTNLGTGPGTQGAQQTRPRSPKTTAARKVLSLFDSPRRVFLRRSRNSVSERSLLQSRSPLQGHQVPQKTREGSDNKEANKKLSSKMDWVKSDNFQRQYPMYIKMDQKFNEENSSSSLSSEKKNLLSWLHDDAPQDIVPKILSFAGPQKIKLLSSLNKSWREVCLSEAVWKTLCEDTRKWIPGRDRGPRNDLMESNVSQSNNMNKAGFWRQYYCDNPAVPIDYSSLEAAFASISSTQYKDDGSTCEVHNRSVRIFLYPAKYVVRKQIVVNAMGNAVVTLETLDVPISKDSCIGESLDLSKLSDCTSSESSSPDFTRSTRRRLGSSSLRDIFNCRSSSAATSGNETSSTGSLATFDSQVQTVATQYHRAKLVMKTRKQTEPIVRVKQGTVRLSNIDMVHNCAGTDIWNGNSAVQIQPHLDDEGEPVLANLPNIPPTAIIEDVGVKSVSGRGVVAIDGGFATVRNCYIHDCAATGIYVGGAGSMARIERTDILKNGNGNERNQRGIARGHSGVYLEQGAATLIDCNISQNSLTGISAISHTNATLVVEESDLVGNGSLQLEMPPTGSVSRRRSVSRNNFISSSGVGRSRSGLVPNDQTKFANDDLRGSELRSHGSLDSATRRSMFAATGGGIMNQISTAVHPVA